jgi:hypothetical protein
MSSLRTSTVFGLALVLTGAVSAWSQQQNTQRIGYVCPAGVRQGTSVVVVIGGRFLDGTTNAFVSGAGVKAKVVDSWRSNAQNQNTTLATKLKRLEQKKDAAMKERDGRAKEDKAKETAAKDDKSKDDKAKDGAAKDDKAKPAKPLRNPWTESDENLLAAMRRKLANYVGGPAVPAIGDNVLVEITVDADAEPGPREIRLETGKGLTNPLTFCIGQLPEFFKEMVLTDEFLSGKGLSRYRDEPRLIPPGEPTKLTLPAVANGQITPGGADRYQFEARKGQRLVIAAAARELIPYIPDAVPGWFQATVTLYDGKGRELAYADHFQFHPDPLLYYEVPADGLYGVEIRDSIYRGREDFVYRLTIGEIPYVTSIFPLGGQAGAQTEVELTGWNLPENRITHDAKEKDPGVQMLHVTKEKVCSNALPFALDTLPEVTEKGPHDRPDTAQPIALPAIVNGRIAQPDEWDVYRFEGRQGDEIVAEVYARRLGSPLDSLVKLTDAAGKQLALNDDHVDKGAGLTTHHADSYMRATLPGAGTYYLHVGDTQHRGGRDYGYRLRVSPSQPDFELRVVPSSFTVRGAASVPVTVYALRRDGFKEAISVELKDAREDATLCEGSVPAGEDEVKLTLKIPPLPPGETFRLCMEGHATIQGKEISRLAVPAEDMMQAFEYRHLVPAQELKVAMVGRFVFKPTAKLISKSPIKIPVGGTAKVQIGATPKYILNNLKLELRRPPQGISIEKVSRSREGLELVLQTDGEKVKPGQRGNLSLTASVVKSDDKAKPNTPPNSQKLPLPTLPAIPFEVVRP